MKESKENFTINKSHCTLPIVEAVANKQPHTTEWDKSIKVHTKGKFSFSDFKNEKELCEYIEKNAKEFCENVLEEDFLSYEREWNMNRDKFFGPRSTSVDFMFRTKQSRCVIIECKRPRNIYSELRGAVSQLLAYSIVCKKNHEHPERHIIVTTGFHTVVSDMIKEFDLPLELFVMGRNTTLRLRN